MHKLGIKGKNTTVKAKLHNRKESIMFDKENFKENLKANKAVYITAISILLTMILIVAAVVATNRDKQTTPKDPTPSTTTTTTTSPKPSTPSDPTVDTGTKLPTFKLPISGKLSGVHDSEIQVFSPTMNDYRIHLGIDVLAKENAPVYAAADGTVTQIWEDVRMGQCIAIKHSGDAVTVYKNLSADIPKEIVEGATVKCGQQIGTVGSTAMVEISDEPHLHFEMTVGGLSVDPLEYFSSADVSSLQKDTAYEKDSSNK